MHTVNRSRFGQCADQSGEPLAKSCRVLFAVISRPTEEVTLNGRHGKLETGRRLAEMSEDLVANAFDGDAER